MDQFDFLSRQRKEQRRLKEVSDSQLSREIFIIGGLTSNDNEQSLIESLGTSDILHIITASEFCAFSNLSNLTAIEERKLKNQMLQLKSKTIIRLSQVHSKMLEKGINYPKVKPYQSDALFLLDVYEDNHSNISICKEILKLSIPLNP